MENLISAKVTKELKESYAKSKLDSMKTEFETRMADLQTKQKKEEENLIIQHQKQIEKLKDEFKVKTEELKNKIKEIELFEFVDPFPTKEKKTRKGKKSLTHTSGRLGSSNYNLDEIFDELIKDYNISKVAKKLDYSYQGMRLVVMKYINGLMIPVDELKDKVEKIKILHEQSKKK